MWGYFIIAASFSVLSVLHCGNCSRILGIFPTASISHQVVFRGLALALNKRGHELVVVTTDPIKDPTLMNYTEIDTSFLYNTPYGSDYINTRENFRWHHFFVELSSVLTMQTEQILSQPVFRKLYEPNSNEKFDLILMEMLFWPAFLPLAKRFEAPIVGISSIGFTINIQYAIGNLIMPSHSSTWQFRSKGLGSTLWQRLVNFIHVWKHIYYYRTVYMRSQEAIAKKYFELDTVDLDEMERNVSLIFVNQQGPISYVRPNSPNAIEIGGFHVSKHTESLSKDLQEILDEATQGFVYMSLGTNVKSNMLSEKARGEFIAAFSMLPYKVIWKFEDNALPGKPDNVMVMKWTPQQAILAHPNLKAFIYQGGMQSTEEAIAHGVPLIGLPVTYDQDMQIDKMVSLGVAKKLEITAIHRDDLVEAIRTVILDSSFKQRMLSLRSILNDKPHDSLEHAIWWTEYVIRHRGAPHLHSSTADEPWYQRQDMDIIALISIGSVIALILILVILYQSLTYSIIAFNDSFLVVKKRKQY